MKSQDIIETKGLGEVKGKMRIFTAEYFPESTELLNTLLLGLGHNTTFTSGQEELFVSNNNPVQFKTL